MSTRRDPDQLIHHFLREGSEQLQDQVYEAVRADIEHRRQRVVIGPWRMPDMNKLVPLGVGIAAVAVAAVIGTRLLAAPAPGVLGSVPSAQPSLTQTFTSQMHGFSVSYPEGWIARAATEPWTDRPGEPEFAHPGFDVLRDPVLGDHLFLRMTSRPIGDSTPDEWVAEQVAGEGCTATEPIVVDGATGLIGADDCDAVAVTTAGRGYSIWLHASGDDPRAVAPYDRAWFEQVLATVQLQPEDAIDAAPSATP